MTQELTSKWWFWLSIVLVAFLGLIAIVGIIFSGFGGICSPYEPISGTTTAIIQNIETRFGRLSSADFKAEASGFGDCQKEIIEGVKADAVGIVNNVQVYFNDVEFKYYWCDAENKVILSSTKMSDVGNYFDSLYTCISDKTTTLFNAK